MDNRKNIKLDEQRHLKQTNEQIKNKQGLTRNPELFEQIAQRNTITLYCLLALCFAILLRLSWKTWPDPLVDFGREVYVPWRILNGEVLYSDISHLFGPLSPYLNALWMALFGTSINAIFIGNIILCILLAAILLTSLERCSSRFSSAIGTLVFILVFAFGHYTDTSNYNFISPYSHQLTHGIILSFITILLVERTLRTTSYLSSLLGGLFFGLTLLTKGEVSVALFSAVACSYGLNALKSQIPTSKTIKLCVVFFIAAFPPIIFAAYSLSGKLEPIAVLQKIFASFPGQVSTEVIKLKFYQELLGLDSLAENIEAMLLWTLTYCAFLAPLFLICFRKVKPTRTAITSAVLYTFATWVLIQKSWFKIARPFPIFLLVAVLFIGLKWLRMRKAGETLDKPQFSITLCVFSLTLMLKLFFNVKLYHYGFALSLPATLIVVVALIDWIPNYIARIGGSKQCFQFVASAIVLTVAAKYAHVQSKYFALKTNVIASQNDQFYTDNNSRLVNASLKEIESTLGENDSLAVLPEGVFLNFLSRRKSTTPFLTLMPPEVLIYGEEKVISSFESHPPDYILLVNRDTSEYGLRFFGSDYAQGIKSWVISNYEPVSLIGHRPFVNTQAGALLLKKKKWSTMENHLVSLEVNTGLRLVSLGD